MVLFKTNYEKYKAGQLVACSNTYARFLRDEGVAYQITDMRLALTAANKAGISPDNGAWLHQWLSDAHTKALPDDRIASVEQIEAMDKPALSASKPASKNENKPAPKQGAQKPDNGTND